MWRSNTACMNGDVQVPECTPFVTAWIGWPGNIPRDTSAWRIDTPLTNPLSSSPTVLMFSSALSSRGICETSATGWAPNTSSASARGNRSWPAGIGVCVVNTQAARTRARHASSCGPAVSPDGPGSRVSSQILRSRSSASSDEWPSFMW